VKPDEDTLPTVPDDPPAAGPDRALDAPPDPRAPAEPLAVADVEGDVAVAEDVPQAESAITAPVSAAVTAHRLLLFGSNRRSFGLVVS